MAISWVNTSPCFSGVPRIVSKRIGVVSSSAVPELPLLFVDWVLLGLFRLHISKHRQFSQHRLLSLHSQRSVLHEEATAGRFRQRKLLNGWRFRCRRLRRPYSHAFVVGGGDLQLIFIAIVVDSSRVASRARRPCLRGLSRFDT